jgi:hypothetical protein
MGKPDFTVYERFRKRYFELTKSFGKEQYLVPYLMSSHPGSTLSDALELALCLKRDHYAPEQVQDYYPTPGTASTVMFYTGIDPLTMKKVYVATDYHEKQLQRALLQYNRPQNAPLVREALSKLGREDLIGFGPECLVRPERTEAHKPSSNTKKPNQNPKKPSARTQPMGNGTRNSKSNSNKQTKVKNRQRSKK